MVIYCSREFAKRYSCELSLPGEKLPQKGRLDDWSAHFIRIGRKPIVMMMHDATLWSVVIPATGVTTLAKLLPLFLERVEGIWGGFGANFDPLNQSLIFLPRTDRSRTGSMNDAIRCSRHMAEIASYEKLPMDWERMEQQLNRTPYKALDYDSPEKKMAELFGEAD